MEPGYMKSGVAMESQGKEVMNWSVGQARLEEWLTGVCLPEDSRWPLPGRWDPETLSAWRRAES